MHVLSYYLGKEGMNDILNIGEGKNEAKKVKNHCLRRFESFLGLV